MEREREERLKAVVGALDSALGEEWVWILMIGHPGDPDSSNVIFNCTPADFKEIVDEVMQRWDEDARPHKMK
jgi:hypothetical protein